MFETLLNRAKQSDRDALGMIWEQWQPRLLRFLRARGAPSPEDTASDIWIDVGRGIRHFEGGEREFATWLFTIARRRVIDVARRAQRRPETLVDSTPERPSLDNVEERALDLDQAIALLHQLPPDQGTAIALRIIADLDVAQVAEIMETSQGGVRMLTHRGLRRLAELLGAPPESADGKIP